MRGQCLYSCNFRVGGGGGGSHKLELEYGVITGICICICICAPYVCIVHTALMRLRRKKNKFFSFFPFLDRPFIMYILNTYVVILYVAYSLSYIYISSKL